MNLPTTAVLAGLVLGSSLARATDRHDFSGNFHIQLVDDSVWWHCEVDISRWDSAKVEEESECRIEDGKPRKSKREMASAEAEVLTQLLRDAALFEGQYWGQDRRGLDFSLLSIAVDDGSRAATVIASFNPSFQTGARKALLDLLAAKAREARK